MLKIKRQTKRNIAKALVLGLCLTLFPSGAFARDTNERDKHTEKYADTTVRYVSGITSKELARAEKIERPTDNRPIKEIEGYEFQRYSEEIAHVYAPKPIPYIVGYPDKTVRPTRYLSRAEAIAIFSRLYDGEYPPKVKSYVEGQFTDVSKDNWFYGEVVKLYESGIIDGANGRLEPNVPISRAELSALATRFNPEKFGVHEGEQKKAFIDVSPDKWYSDAVSIAQANGWITGYPDGTFNPNVSITRAETMAIVNRVLDRTVTVERLRQLGIKNPYIDIDEAHWNYTDALEATIKHSAEEWQGLSFNKGEYNVTINRYVDKDGKELHKEEVVKHSHRSRAEDAVKRFAGQHYLGYVATVTYQYDLGKPMPELTKTANLGKTGGLVPGDTVLYEIKATNSDKGTGRIIGAYLEDTIPEGVELVKGSVTIDNKTVNYIYDEKTRLLTIPFEMDGSKDIVRGKSYMFGFAVTINSDSWKKTIQNTAYLKGKNIPDTPASDEGYTVNDGKAKLDIKKTADKEEVKVGDTITYNLAVTNTRESDTLARNAWVMDTIESVLDFAGHVTVDGKSTEYSYDEKTKVLKVELGNIEKEKTKNVSFKVTVNKTGYGLSAENTGIAGADNAEDVQDKAKLIPIAEGKAYLSITKEPNKEVMEVGEKLTYTIVVSSDEISEVDAKNAFITDTIPEELDFIGQVEVDGIGTPYVYNQDTRILKVNLGNIAPNTSKRITLSTIANKSGYGKSVVNTAVVTSDNTTPKTATSKITVIKEGVPSPRISSKEPNKVIAKPGELVTYRITLENQSVATGSWKNVEVIDFIPKDFEFMGNVRLNDRSTTSYYFAPERRTLRLLPPDLAPGEQAIFEFDVTPRVGTEGKTIVNVAELYQPNKPREPIPSTPVQVPGGEVTLDMDKTHSPQPDAFHEGDTIEFTVDMRNTSRDANWKDVVFTDILPNELELYGAVLVNDHTVQHRMDGNTITVNLHEYVGDIEPKERVRVRYTTKVKDGSALENDAKILTNVAEAIGTNGRAKVDDSVRLEPKEDPTEKQVVAVKTANKNTVDLRQDPRVTYRISMVNNDDKDWTNVRIVDQLDTTYLHLYKDSVKLNGVPLVMGQGFSYDPKVDMLDTLKINVGDIPVGKAVNVTFDVRFENDVYRKPNGYTNTANITSSSHDPLNPDVTLTGFTNPGNTTGIHHPIFVGFPSKKWRLGSDPADYVSLQDASDAILRALPQWKFDELKAQTGGGQFIEQARRNIEASGLEDEDRDNVLKEFDRAESLKFMIGIGGLGPSDFTAFKKGVRWNTEMPADGDITAKGLKFYMSRHHFGRMLEVVGLEKTGAGDFSNINPLVKTKRIDFARQLNRVLNRDERPDINGMAVKPFTDVPPDHHEYKLVSEVSTWHNYVLKADDSELWVISDITKAPWGRP